AVARGGAGLFLNGLLAILAAPLPGLPVFAFQLIDARQLTELGLLEVVQPLPLPLGLDGFQIPADGSLVDADFAGDLVLGPLLQIQPGHAGAALLHLQLGGRNVVVHDKLPERSSQLYTSDYGSRYDEQFGEQTWLTMPAGADLCSR